MATGCQSANPGAGTASPAEPPPYPQAVVVPRGAWLVATDNIEGNGSDIAAAAADAFMKIERRLAQVGLDRTNLVSVRADLTAGDGSEFTEWDSAWKACFATGAPPARTTVGRTGLSAKVVLGVRAALPVGVTAGSFPSAMKAPDSDLWIAGAGTEVLVFVNGEQFADAEQIFFSGVVAPEGTAPSRQGAAVMNLLTERVTRLGARMDQVVGLQVFHTAGERGFDDAYNNAADNRRDPLGVGPRKHVVESLPGGRVVEVEAAVVRPVRGR
ncbi:MAG: RidA family protein [Gemmatimonadota bacterium]|nr:RidA family protein [Gemmatimonadota bacterium]